jgi:histidinol-phosphatase (PHP family)
MSLYDQHLHTCFSMDSEADPRENVRQALELGLAGLTFTDHFDTHPSEWDKCCYDYERLAEIVAELREQYGDRIFIGHGIEICYQPAKMPAVLDFLRKKNFDLVLLSVHWFDGRALHEKDHWAGLDTSGATRLYLQTVLEAVHFTNELKKKGEKPFDVLGHLDLVKRYTQRYFENYDIRAHAELVGEILQACLDADLIPEVNLSSRRQSLPEPMPADWVIAEYAKLGGRSMTLGSDAHKPEQIGRGLGEGAELLKQNGIHNLAVFRNRHRTDQPL